MTVVIVSDSFMPDDVIVSDISCPMTSLQCDVSCLMTLLLLYDHCPPVLVQPAYVSHNTHSFTMSACDHTHAASLSVESKTLHQLL